MTITSHLPVVSPAHSAATLRALALLPGQTIQGRVLGPGLDGATLVQVGLQTMSLSLPMTAADGATLTLSVQQSEGQLRLALLDVRQPPVGVQQAATSVEISQRPAVAQGPLTYAPPGGFSSAAQAATGPQVIAGLGAGATTPGTGFSTPALPAGTQVTPALAAASPSGGAAQRPGLSPYGMPSMPLPSISSPQSQVNALMQMVQQALPTQSSIGSVMGMLNALSAQALPEPVMRAAKQLFENQLVAKDGKINAAALKTAIGISGIFQEAKLGQGKPEAATADTKSALLAMRQGLAQWLGDQTPIAQIKQPLPPLKHASPRAKLPELALEEMPADAEEFGRLLLDRTEGALARLRLHQHASLPDANKPGDQQWNLDLPLAYGSQQTVLSLQIEHDGGGDPSRTDDRGWQVRFAVNLKGLGEIGAQVSLRGQNAGVLLWAEEGATATQLSSAIDELRTDLERAGLTPGALVVRHGAPGDAMRPGSTGQFLDASR